MRWLVYSYIKPDPISKKQKGNTMKIDKHDVLIIEKDGEPGDLGDACAETCRYLVLAEYADSFPFGRPTTLPFITSHGGLRHPDVPESWRESDFTSDQALPLRMANDNVGRRFALTTAPGKLSSPGLFFLSLGMLRCLNLVNGIQGLLFKAPVRWNDGNPGDLFEANDDSSADYLNWIVTACYLADNGIKPILNADKEHVRAKVHSYYSNQMNVEKTLALYDLAIDKVYGVTR